MQRGDRMRNAALGNHIPCAALAAAALGGHAQLELDLVETHASMCMACNFAVRNPAADTNDHGAGSVGWLLTMGHYKCEFIAFAIRGIDPFEKTVY